MSLKEIATKLEAAKASLPATPYFVDADWDCLDPEDLRRFARICRSLAHIQLMIETACDELGFDLRTFAENDRQLDGEPAIAYLYGKGKLLDVARQQSNMISGLLASMATDIDAMRKELDEEGRA